MLLNVPTDSAFVTPKGFLSRIAIDWLNTLAFGEVIRDTRAKRSTYPTTANKNRLYYETDTTLFYLSTGTAWIWVAGEYKRTQSQIATLVAGLGVNDTGLIVNVTDFAHRLVWGGAALAFASGDDGSNYFIDAPSLPQGKIVQLCDGTVTTYLKSDGTTGSYTTQNLTGHYRKSVTAGADAVVAAHAPAFTGTSATLTGSVTAPVFTGNAGTTGNDGDAGSHAAVGAGSDPLVALNPHTHSFTPTGSNSVPTLTMNSYTPAGTIDTTGEPAAYKVLTYFRR